tara:strand:+ start:1764 stop:2402 length:639 start_codon:yes stop_codon:yes gene_type:complete
MTEKFQELIEIPKPKGSQRRIGLTGGIASGKSSIGSFLKANKGLPILDADVFSREALAPNTISNEAIVKRYKNQVITGPSGIIDRKLLAKIIFSDIEERHWLESLLHPIIYTKLLNNLEKRRNCPIVILIIPLLFEANLTSICNEIWVVKCTKKQQYQRLMKRDKITEGEAKKRIEAQWPLEKKAELADEVIDNSGKSNDWHEQIEKLLAKT